MAPRVSKKAAKKGTKKAAMGKKVSAKKKQSPKKVSTYKPKYNYPKGKVLKDIIDASGLDKKLVAAVMGTLVDVGHEELKKKGAFILPGFAKFVVKKTKARKSRSGINPFTKEPMVFKAKPASKKVTARPAKAIKEVIVPAK